MEGPKPSTPANGQDRTNIVRELLSKGFTREDIEKLVGELRCLLDSEDPQKAVSTPKSTSSTALQTEVEDTTKTPERNDACDKHDDSVILVSTRSGHSSSSTIDTVKLPSDNADRRPTSPSPGRIISSKYANSIGGSSESKKSQKSRVQHEGGFSQSPSSSVRRRRINLDEAMKMQSCSSRRSSESEESEESGDETIQNIFALKNLSSPQYRNSNYTATQKYVSGSSHYYRQDNHIESSPIMTTKNRYYRDAETRPSTPCNKRYMDLLDPSSSLSRSVNSYYRKTTVSKRVATDVLSSLPSSPRISSYPLASSPGPMSDLPDQNSGDLPYQLPPGPYSHEKPEHSYAALIGQAILASSIHALRLKDIYDYISIVYPYFKRDGHSHSQKWMNAIRQNLTNTPQFYKREHPSGKQSKGALWCISDENLPCFANGGYNRHALNPNSSQAEKAEKRKRKREEKLREEKAKRTRTSLTQNFASFSASTTPNIFPYYSQNTLSQSSASASNSKVDADIIFPPLPKDHPNAHLINGSLSSNNTVVDAGVLFPPLPEFSGTRIVRERMEKELAQRASESSLVESCSQTSSQAVTDSGRTSPVPAPPLSSGSSSVPELTPNSSSSPDELSEDTVQSILTYVRLTSANSEDDQEEFLSQQDAESLFDEYIDSEAHSEVCSDSQSLFEDQEEPVEYNDKGKGRAFEPFSFLSLPASPTMARKAVARSPSTSLYASSGFLGQPSSSGRETKRTSTPPSNLLSLADIGFNNFPSTPTPNKRATKSMDDLFGIDEPPSFMNTVPRTPQRRHADLAGGPPLTPSPKKYSPFNVFSGSPFRTPSRRIVDETDPGVMLRNELDSLAARPLGASESPAGFFSRKNFFFESPTLPSPDKWTSEVWRAW